jgi:preflagellin peptidase FlaK
MIEVLLLLTALAGAAYASYSDIKHGVIPNRLSLPLILLGLGSYTAYSVYAGEYRLLREVLKNFGLIFILGYLFWLLGGWSAGDAKEFMFLAALVPTYPEILRNFFDPVLPPYPFSVSMLLNTFILVFPFIALYAFLLTYQKVGPREMWRPLRDYRGTARTALMLTAAFAAVEATKTLPAGVAVLLLLAVLRNPRTGGAAAVMIIGVSVAATGGYVSAAKGYVFFFVASATLRFFIHLVSLLLRKGLRREMRITELEEGMILGETIYQENGGIRRDPRTRIERLMEFLRTGRKEGGRPIVQGGAAGLTDEDVQRLRELVREGRLEDKILVTRGVPFSPAILLGFLASLAVGDLALYLEAMT